MQIRFLNTCHSVVDFKLLGHLACATLVAIALSACGGGGGTAAAPPYTPPSPASLERYTSVSEFQNQPALSLVNAQYAYARGATGLGVTIGMVDNGVDTSHPEFSGRKILSSSRYQSGYSPDFTSCSPRDATTGRCPTTSLPTHGTRVGSVMVANRNLGSNPISMHGVAFNSRLYFEGIQLGSGGGTIRYSKAPLNLADPSATDDFYAGIARRMNNQVSVVNLSFNYNVSIVGSDASHLSSVIPNTLAQIRQASRRPAERTVYVWSAGNAGRETDPQISGSPLILASLPYPFPELRSNFLTVVAVDTSSGDIAAYSNRCGLAKDFCLAAPGTVSAAVPVTLCYANPTLGQGCYTPSTSGTSFAAPIVAASFALLKQHFQNQLGNDEIVRRLKDTANRSGKYSNADIYGRGLLDLDRATRPVRTTRVLTGASLTGKYALADKSSVDLGAAFGDAIASGMGNREIAVFDELDAPFFYSFNDYVRIDTASETRLIDRFQMLGYKSQAHSWSLDDFFMPTRIDGNIQNSQEPQASHEFGVVAIEHQADNFQGFLGYRSHPGWQFGLHSQGILPHGTFTEDSVFTSPVLSFVRNGVIAGVSKPLTNFKNGSYRIAAFSGRQQYGNRRDDTSRMAQGLLLETSPLKTKSSGISVQAGWLHEPHSVVGSSFRGAFGDLRTNSGFFGITGYKQINSRWKFLANAHAGITRTAVRGSGIVPTVSSLQTSTFDLGVIGESALHRRDRFGIRLSQPLRIESGEAEFEWVTGRTPHREVLREKTRIPLEPSGRQLDLELTYGLPWRGGWADFAAIVSRNHGHTANVDNSTVLMRYQREF